MIYNDSLRFFYLPARKQVVVRTIGVIENIICSRFLAISTTINNLSQRNYHLSLPCKITYGFLMFQKIIFLQHTNHFFCIFFIYSNK